jgi:hypothetical protein
MSGFSAQQSCMQVRMYSGHSTSMSRSSSKSGLNGS